jgi:hypothetical protein
MHFRLTDLCRILYISSEVQTAQACYCADQFADVKYNNIAHAFIVSELLNFSAVTEFDSMTEGNTCITCWLCSIYIVSKRLLLYLDG